MIIPKEVKEYIDLYKKKKIRLNEDRKLLIKQLESDVFVRDDLYFDDDLIKKCIKFIEKWYFELMPFQKFIISFFFLYTEEGNRYYRKFLIMMGRGGGKNGLISGLSNFLISELHGIKGYNVAIIANSESQAKTSFKEIYETIEEHPVMQKAFDHKKAHITSRKTNSSIEYLTSNAKTKDSRRDGITIFDEVHMYPDDSIVRVMNSGLGKVPHPREVYISTNGTLREGFLDEMLNDAQDGLKGITNNNMFSFICKIDHPDEIHDKDNWQLANPMFSGEMTEYGKTLFETVEEEYNVLPRGRLEFMTKRMNFPEGDPEKDVASREQLMDTVQEYPDLTNKVGMGSFDYASMRDFASCGIMFKENDKYYWITHTFARKEYIEQVKIKAPLREWEQDGLLTIVDEPSIDPEHIVNWFNEKQEYYGIQKVVADNFRMDLLKPLLEENGYEYEFIRNPSGVQSKIAPIVETAFSNGQVVYGDNPLMRWMTNNTYVKIDKRGNKTYEKKEPKARKTDGFDAFLLAMYKMDELEEDFEFLLADISF